MKKAALMALFVIATAWPAAAQDAARDAAIKKCLEVAAPTTAGGTTAPGSDQQVRIAAYSACMAKEGQRP